MLTFHLLISAVSQCGISTHTAVWAHSWLTVNCDVDVGCAPFTREFFAKQDDGRDWHDCFLFTAPISDAMHHVSHDRIRCHL